jgi:hypothetical protein
MLRKSLMTLAAAAVVAGATMLAPTDASARWGYGWRGHGWGWGGPRFVGPRFYGARFWGPPVVVGAPVVVAGYSCWRWVPGVWGPVRVWVC